MISPHPYQYSITSHFTLFTLQNTLSDILLDPEKLFPLLDYENPRIINWTYLILAKIQHQTVRELALQLIQEGKLENRAISLLTINAQEGDWSLIEEVSKRDYSSREYPSDEFHSIQYAAGRAFFKQNPDKAALNTLLYLYEHAPCSDCRYYILENLQAIDELTDNIKEECFFDSNSDIREWAQKGFLTEV